MTCILPYVSYAASLKKILPQDLRRLFSRLHSPNLVQDYLDTLPINFEVSGESTLSPIQVFQKQTAHCLEGAIFATAALAFHGHKPLLMDFATAYDDEDHCVALFKRGKYWGAISKTNHIVLRFRDAIYASPRELAMSFFNEYYLNDGRKSFRAYSAPFDLSRFEPEKWVTAGDSEITLDWIMKRMARNRYFPIVPQNFERHLRRVSPVEIRALDLKEWVDPRRKVQR